MPAGTTVGLHENDKTATVDNLFRNLYWHNSGPGSSLGNEDTERWPESRTATSAVAPYTARWSRAGPIGPETHAGTLIPWWFRLVQIFRNRRGWKDFLCA